jgi:hypothetical protein
MKWVAISVLLCLLVLYGLIGMFGFTMSAFCFDSGTQPEAWNCFAGINLVFILPSLICLVSGVVLLLMRRYKLSMVVAAVPALLVAVGLVMVFIANTYYFVSR